jgi:hypothetical protein
MQQSYPGIDPDIENWKGQEITDFQEDLRIKANAHISEKWFYTHMKASNKTLPRIDMLNILSQYAGYANWDDLIYKNRQTAPAELVAAKANRFFIIVPLVALLIVGSLFGIYKLFNTRDYRFAFMDAHTRELITNGNIEVIILREGESPVHSLAGMDGYYHLRTDQSRIRMVIKSPYYHSDTVVRTVKKFVKDETVMLNPDDYAMMIHYFSTMKVDDWEKRRNRLNEIFDDAAMIYQVFRDKGQTGMALYNKQEFIDRLTLPAGSLKNIEILESKQRDGKIMVLRFRTHEPTR